MALRCLAPDRWAAACRPAPHREKLVVAYPLGPTSLIPDTANEEFADSTLRNVYESLVEIDAGLGLRPGLAESWSTPDEQTWEFHLRGVRLHNGRLLKAGDVVSSIEHARSDPASRRRAQLAVLRSVEAGGLRTVVVRTRSPFEPVPTRLSNISVWAPAARDGEPPLGTGPYRVRSWSPGGDTVLEAFQDYRGGPPPIPVVEFVVIPDREEQLRRLRKGSVQLVVDAPAERMSELEATPGVRTVSRGGLRILFLGLDCAHETTPHAGPGRNPFRDVRVRGAVALAIDRRRLVAGPLAGYAEVIEQIADPHEIGYAKDLPERPYDPTVARRLLAEASRGDGFRVTLDYMPGKYRGVEAVVGAIVQDLAKVGVRVDLRPGKPAEMVSRVETRDTAFYLLGWLSEVGDVRLSYEYLLHTPGQGFGLDNGSGYSDEQFDHLIEEVSERLPPEERRDRLSRLARKVYEDVPIIPLYRQADLYAVARDLRFEPRIDRRIKAAEIGWASQR